MRRRADTVNRFANRRPKNPNVQRPVCPTCGSRNSTYAVVRHGRYRVMQDTWDGRWTHFRQGRIRAFPSISRKAGRGSLRVKYRWCRDPFHYTDQPWLNLRWRPPTWRDVPAATHEEADDDGRLPTTRPPRPDVRKKKKQKARRHRDHQSKARR